MRWAWQLDKVKVTLADARPELLFNQFTGGSNSMHSIFTQVRMAAAVAMGQMTRTAATMSAASATDLTVQNGQIVAPGGKATTIGELAQRGAVSKTTRGPAQLKSQSQFTLVGTPQRRVDALDIVTGRKQFAMDLDVPGALPTMLCRPPTINATALAVLNMAQVMAMPGITDVAIIPHTNSSPAESRCGVRRSGSASTRSTHFRWRGARARWTGSQIRTCSPICARRSSRSRRRVGLLAKIGRAGVHVLLPSGRPARDELCDRRRSKRQGRGLVEPEVADLGAASSSR